MDCALLVVPLVATALLGWQPVGGVPPAHTITHSKSLAASNHVPGRQRSEISMTSWSGSVTSPDRLLQVTAEGTAVRPVCVYYHMPAGTPGAEKAASISGVSIAMSQFTRRPLRDWLFVRCPVSVLYMAQSGSTPNTAHQHALQLLPKELPSLVCYRGAFETSAVRIPEGTSSFGNFRILVKWFGQELNSRRSTLRRSLSVDSTVDIRSCVDGGAHMCAVAYVPHLSPSGEMASVLEGFAKRCQDVVHGRRCFLASPRYPHLKSLAAGITGVWTSGGIWLFHALKGRERMFQFNKDGLVRFHLHTVMTTASSEALADDNFVDTVLGGSAPWVVLFVNCNDEPQQIRKSIRLIEVLSGARQIGLRRSELKFGVVDTACSKRVMTSVVQPDLLTSLPLVILFQRSTEDMRQIRLDVTSLLGPGPAAYLTDMVLGRPAPEEPHESVASIVDAVEAINETLAGPLAGQCPIANTTMLWYLTRQTVRSSASTGGEEQIASPDDLADGIQDVTMSTWNDYFRPRSPKNTTLSGASLVAARTELKVVFVTRANCRNCEQKAGAYSEAARKYRHNAFATFGHINCSDSRSLALCAQLRVAEEHGFPALFAWRVLHMDRNVDSKCEIMDSLQNGNEHDWLRVDYHNALSAEEITSWVEMLLEPSVRLQSTDTTSASVDTEKHFHVVGAGATARLHAIFAFAPVAADSLPSKHFSWECYQLVCRHLFAVAHCSAQVQGQAPALQSARNSVLLLSKLEFRRIDNETATVFKHGRSVEATMASESSEHLHSNLFHKPHRYGLLPTSHCEDNTPVCSRYIVQFVRDHARLPVMALSYTNFHRAKSLDSLIDAGAEDDNLPHLVLIYSSSSNAEPVAVAAEVDTADLGQLDNVLPSLTVVAQRSYASVKSVTLDVEEVGSWADRFVPLGYFSKFDVNPTPRLCWIDRHNHSRAAFYPAPSHMSGELLRLDATSGTLIENMMEFVKSTDKDFIPTENF